jgi:hypothetical protein
VHLGRIEKGAFPKSKGFSLFVASLSFSFRFEWKKTRLFSTLAWAGSTEELQVLQAKNAMDSITFLVNLPTGSMQHKSKYFTTRLTFFKFL